MGSRTRRQTAHRNSTTSVKFENISEVLLDRVKADVLLRLKRITTVDMPPNGRVKPGAPSPIPLPPGVIVQKKDRKQKTRKKHRGVGEDAALGESPLEMSIQNRISSFTAPIDGTAAFRFFFCSTQLYSNGHCEQRRRFSGRTNKKCNFSIFECPVWRRHAVSTAPCCNRGTAGCMFKNY